MKFSDAAKAVFYISGAVFFALLSLSVFQASRFANRELVPMLRARDAQIAAVLTTVDATSKKNADNIDVTLTNIKALTGDADDSIEQIAGALLDDKFGLIPHADALLSSLNQVAGDSDKAAISLNAEIAETGNSVRSDVLAPLSADLADIDPLLKTARGEIADNGAASEVTLDSLTKAISDADRLVADPDIKAAIAHVDSSTESIDDALLPWRKRAALLKQILEKVGNALLNNAVLFFR